MLDLSPNAEVRKIISYLFAVAVGIVTIAVMSWNSGVVRERDAAAARDASTTVEQRAAVIHNR